MLETQGNLFGSYFAPVYRKTLSIGFIDETYENNCLSFMSYYELFMTQAQATRGKHFIPDMFLNW